MSNADRIAQIVEYSDHRWKLIDDQNEVHWLTGYEFASKVERTVGWYVILRWFSTSSAGYYRAIANTQEPVR